MIENTNEKEKKDAPEKERPQKSATIVTSTRTVDFPAHGWGINAGESRELPDDEHAQKEILSKHYISVKN